VKKNSLSYFLILLVAFASQFVLAQNEPNNDVVTIDDGFEDLFYESIKQKGIENYDMAIDALEKAKVIQPENSVIYFELGKNYLALKKYNDAYLNFEKVTKMDPKNRWAWAGMYDVFYDTREFEKAIPIVEKLIEFKEDYKEDLTSLYMNTQQFDKALDLINELNSIFGKSEKRDLYKLDILKESKYQSAEKYNLLEQIKKFPKEEANYVDLIFLYSSNNQEDKALEIAKKLEKEIPTSDWAQVTFFKYHLDNNDGANMVTAMNVVLKSKKIDSKIKHRILNEFLIFTKKNPAFESDLDRAITFFENDKFVDVAKEIGKFYYSKSDWVKATKYFEMHLKNNESDVETHILLLQALIENQNFELLASKSEDLIQLFPTQPEFYYFGGLANNQIKNFKKAVEILESGYDFVIDNYSLEINFNIQLGEASHGIGDSLKKEKYFSKANELIKKHNK